MTYAQARSTLRTGDIIAQTHRSWFRSWHDFKVMLIRLWGQTEYAHVGLIWRSGGRVFVIEAVKPRVRIFPLSLIGDFYHIPMNRDLSMAAEDYAFRQIGEPYSEGLAVLTALKLVDKGDYGVWHCAKLVNEILRENKFDFGLAFTPGEIVREALAAGKRLRHVENGGIK